MRKPMLPTATSEGCEPPVETGVDSERSGHRSGSRGTVQNGVRHAANGFAIAGCPTTFGMDSPESGIR